MEDVSLKEYIEARLAELERILVIKYDFHEKSVELAKREADLKISYTKSELDRRLESMNRFREQLDNERGTFITRERFDFEHRILTDKIDDLQLWKSEQQGRNDKANTISILAIVVSVCVAIAITVLHFFK